MRGGPRLPCHRTLLPLASFQRGKCAGIAYAGREGCRWRERQHTAFKCARFFARSLERNSNPPLSPQPSHSDDARAASWAAAAPTRASSLLTAAQLDALWSAVRGAARARTPPPAPLPSDRDDDACDDRPPSPDAAGAVLDYAAFRRAAAGAAARAGPAAARLLTARAFLRLAVDGEVDADALCDYLGQRAGQLQMVRERERERG